MATVLTRNLTEAYRGVDCSAEQERMISSDTPVFGATDVLVLQALGAFNSYNDPQTGEPSPPEVVDGIHRILANPKPPTAELRAALANRKRIPKGRFG